MAVYAVSSCCGVTLDSISDPYVYVEHGLRTEFYCTERRCLAEAFGDCIDAIFSIFALALENADQYRDEEARVVCMYQEAAE